MTNKQKMTSAEAAKLLRKWNEELAALEERENISREFVATAGEDLEAVRPEYDYAIMQERIRELEGRIRALKHALNLFNAKTLIPEFAMTIDQLLVYIPQLSKKKAKLAQMAAKLPLSREVRYNSNLVEYRYTNYDPEEVRADLEAVSDELAQAQTLLDTVNNTKTFDFAIE